MNIACFVVEQSVSQKCQGHHWMWNWMLYSTMGSEWGQLDNKKKKKWKKRFFQHLSLPPGYSFHEHCLFSGWTKRLTEMPRASLDAELNALFNHGVRMRPAWQQKKKKMKKKIFSLYHSSSHLKITRTLRVLWLNKASHRNAKGTIGCRIECSIQPWGQNEASLTTKKKKMKKKIFSAFITTTRLQFPRTLPVFWLIQASHRNAKGIIGCRIECSIQPWGQNEASLTTKKKKNEKKDFYSIYQYYPVTVSTNIACFLVEPSVSQKCQGHHWMQNWMLYSTMGSEWGQLDNKKKKKWKKRFFQHLSVLPGYSFHEHCLFFGWTKRLTEMPRASLDAELNALFNHGVRMRPAWQQKKKKLKKKIFSAFISTTRSQFPRTLPVFWLNQASHRNAKGTIGCRIECSIQPWGQNEASLTTKKKKNEKKDFFSIYQYHPVTVSTNIACFLVEPSVSQKCQGHHWMQNWMLYSTMGSEWGQLDKKKKKKWKKRFFQHLSVPPGYSFHEHCLFSGWTKRLTEMPRASLDAELNALFNHGVRMRPAWQQKKKKMKKKIFSAFISTTRLQFPRTLPVFWLNQASHRNAKGTIGCRIECSIQPWGQNEASLTTKKKKNEKKDFFVISQQ